MTDQRAAQNVLRHIDQGALIELAMSLIRIPSFIGEETPVARYGDDDAHLWEAGIPAPIYGPAGGSYGEDFTDIDEMLLCSQVLALTAMDTCA